MFIMSWCETDGGQSMRFPAYDGVNGVTYAWCVDVDLAHGYETW